MRVPKKLHKYFNNKTFYRSLSTDMRTAKLLAHKYDAAFSQAILAVDLGFDPKLDILTSEPVSKNNTSTSAKLKYIIREYLDKQDTSEAAIKKMNQYFRIINELIGDNLTQKSIDKFRSNICKLPKGNIQKYKSIPVKQLVQMDISENDLIGTKTRNDYVKLIRSLIKFAYSRKLVDREFDIKSFKHETSQRNQRKALSWNSIQKLIDGSNNDKLSYAYKLLYYSGMRLSEAYKCRISTIDGIKCFDLTDTSVKLKTEASYRLIPVSKYITEPEKYIEAIRSLDSHYITKQASKQLGEKESLYSLRHSFVTDLINAKVDPSVVSELAGHSHRTMTLSRYSKGYDVKILKEAIDKLNQ